jgi:LysR family transcriptional regulator, mexEF-oprN operon transcriptional activator
MNRIDLRTLDLNLMKAFVALEEDRNVTRSAKKLGIGQPAVSHALARLRQLTQDELFVRGHGGMMPTPRALELIGPIRAALSQIEAALAGQPAFDPASSRKRFTIGASDFVAAAVLPSLSKALARAAPGTSIAVRNADRNNAAQLIDAREIDLAVGLFPQASMWHRKERLFEEGHVCAFNAKLVKASSPITLKEFVAYPHILVTLRGDEKGFVDEILTRRKLSRQVAVATPFFLLAGYLLHEQPMIATLPRRYAELCAVTAKLSISPLPFASPKFDISMMWHARDETNPALVLLRRLLSGNKS